MQTLLPLCRPGIYFFYKETAGYFFYLYGCGAVSCFFVQFIPVSLNRSFSVRNRVEVIQGSHPAVLHVDTHFLGGSLQVAVQQKPENFQVLPAVIVYGCMILVDEKYNPAADIIDSVHDVHHVAVSAVFDDEQMHRSV